MRYKIVSNITAMVTLTAREADLVRARRVPMIYGRGGLSPHPIETPTGPVTIKFGGATFVDPRARLIEALGLFSEALSNQIARDDAAQDHAAGFNAFRSVSGRYMDATRGTKGYPDMPRCPFKIAARAMAWKRGLGDAINACHAA